MLEVFVPVVATGKHHPYFKYLMQLQNVYIFDVMNDWLRGLVDRDNKFVKEFQTDFNSSFWESYIFTVLKQYGFSVNLSRSSPDFCISNARFNIEAVVASHAQGDVPEHSKEGLTGC